MGSSKTDLVVRKLFDRIRIQIEKSETRLPTVRSLASQYRVSKPTVTKALAVLRKQGLIEAGPHRGIHILSQVTASDFKLQTAVSGQSDEPMTHWQYVRKSITDDIFKGIYPPGSLLPSVKELIEHYGACFETIKRALISLVKEERLVPFKKRYRVFQPTRRHHRSTLIVVGGFNLVEQAAAVTFSFRATEVWRTLQWESNRLGLDIEIFSVQDTLDSFNKESDRHRHFRFLHENRVIAGYFIWIHKMSFDELNNLCVALSQTEKPVALFDNMQTIGVPRIVTRNHRFKLFTMALGVSSGKMVGEYMLGLGHRRIACFNFTTIQTWSRERIDGVVKAYESAGLTDAVSRIAVDCFDEWLGPQVSSPENRSFKEIQRYFLRAAKVINPDFDKNDNSLFETTRRWLWRCQLDYVIKPLLDKVVLDKRITAWVGVNDSLALSCLKYLHAKGIRVPQDLSVIGFDDITESLTEGLTSYNFNITATIAAMLDHISSGKITQPISGNAPIEIPGMIVERASTRRLSEAAAK
jgi:DNA-binding transcriptional regulator YhcF (GntR family)